MAQQIALLCTVELQRLERAQCWPRDRNNKEPDLCVCSKTNQCSPPMIGYSAHKQEAGLLVDKGLLYAVLLEQVVSNSDPWCCIMNKIS